MRLRLMTFEYLPRSEGGRQNNGGAEFESLGADLLLLYESERATLKKRQTEENNSTASPPVTYIWNLVLFGQLNGCDCLNADTEVLFYTFLAGNSRLRGRRVRVDSIPQYLYPYERGPDLELWEISKPVYIR
jgi:hypothetical protein